MKTVSRPRRSTGGLMLALALAVAGGGCRSCGAEPPHPRRAAPICAVQDCATGKTVDDGCADDGRCLSCINACSPADAPTSRP